MKKYKKLIDLLVNMGDCIVFEIETFNYLFYTIDENDIYNRFNSIVKKNTILDNNYENYRQLVISNDEKNKQMIYEALRSLIKIESEIVFKCLVTEYGFLKYEQNLGNLIVGCKNSEITKSYLLNIDSIWNWSGIRPSNFAVYQKGKCIFQLLTNDKCIFVSDLNLFKKIKKMYHLCKLKDISDSYVLKYPYELNDDGTSIDI